MKRTLLILISCAVLVSCSDGVDRMGISKAKFETMSLDAQTLLLNASGENGTQGLIEAHFKLAQCEQAWKRTANEPEAMAGNSDFYNELSEYARKADKNVLRKISSGVGGGEFNEKIPAAKSVLTSHRQAMDYCTGDIVSTTARISNPPE